jgi:rhodanese-related sulfurtransferase
VAGCSSDGSDQASESEKFLSADELKKMMDSGREELVLIDVRTPLEYAAGYIPGATLIPYTEIAQRTKEIPKDKLVVLYCTVGVRSERARQKLEELGYTKVVNFAGVKYWPYKLEKPPEGQGL